ncbi:MAG: ABC transporter permease [Clostridia bacterium]|nr:ABC transporter permease [Clostridia bacterium]
MYGYYESKDNRNDYLVNNNTVKYSIINNQTGAMIYPNNTLVAMNKFKNEYNQNIVNRYEADRNTYINNQKDRVTGGVIFAGIILAISLIEIYLIMRSSFLSRIKEIGVLRAVGVKKQDIYKMFVGEILAITTLSGVPGAVLMTYILETLSKVPYMSRMFEINLQTVLISITIAYVCNIVFGLMPLFNILRKTPAKILARHDI